MLGSGTAADAMKNNPGLMTTAVASTDCFADLLAAIKAAYHHLIDSGLYAEILTANEVSHGAIEEAVNCIEGSEPQVYRPRHVGAFCRRDQVWLVSCSRSPGWKPSSVHMRIAP